VNERATSATSAAAGKESESSVKEEATKVDGKAVITSKVGGAAKDADDQLEISDEDSDGNNPSKSTSKAPTTAQASGEDQATGSDGASRGGEGPAVVAAQNGGSASPVVPPSSDGSAANTDQPAASALADDGTVPPPVAKTLQESSTAASQSPTRIAEDVDVADEAKTTNSSKEAAEAQLPACAKPTAGKNDPVVEVAGVSGNLASPPGALQAPAAFSLAANNTHVLGVELMPYSISRRFRTFRNYGRKRIDVGQNKDLALTQKVWKLKRSPADSSKKKSSEVKVSCVVAVH